MEKIGITTTVPSELIFASGAVPVDLNNIFITSGHRKDFIRSAERAGYPRNVCGWIKGLYGTVLATPEIKRIVCRNTGRLLEYPCSHGNAPA